jgi:predicted methyltransferase
MPERRIRDGLLFALAARYKEDPRQFLIVSRQTLDSPVARGVIAELRNEGYVEEQIRGVIRFTSRGYKLFRNEPLPYRFV